MVCLRACLIALLMGQAAPFASAEAVHKIHFVQSPKVLVWMNDTLVGEGARLPLLETDLQAESPGIGSGVLVPIGFNPPHATRRATFRIASNSSFRIETSPLETRDDIVVRVLGQGANAQKLSAGEHLPAGIVFEQLDKTAVRRGTPESQSLEFEVVWTASQPPNLWVHAVGS